MIPAEMWADPNCWSYIHHLLLRGCTSRSARRRIKKALRLLYNKIDDEEITPEVFEWELGELGLTADAVREYRRRCEASREYMRWFTGQMS